MDGTKPTISIIVPVYKVEPYLDRCMESLLGQTFSDIEIILVDDGSPDRCPEMCDAYARMDSRVKVIHKENEGLGFARNSGLDLASGEYAAFVDSDDYVTRDMCEKLLRRARETDADIVYGGAFYHHGERGDRKSFGNDTERLWRGEEKIRQLLLNFVAMAPGRTKDTVMEVAVWRALFRRQVLEENGIRFVSERVFIAEDMIFNIDMLQKCRCVATITDPVYYYCLNPSSLSKTFREDRFQRRKELYYEMGRRLSLLYREEEYRIRCERFLIASARRYARAVVRQRKRAGKAQVRRWLVSLCEDEELRRVLGTYPITRLPYQQFAAAWLMKKQMYFPLEVLLRVKRR